MKKERNRRRFCYIINMAIVLFFSTITTVTFAQQQKLVTGTISDSEGPLPGVNVKIKGSNKVTTTIENGKFSIQARAKDTLVFTMVGMKVQQQVVGTRSTINVIMQADSDLLDEVVVIAYGSVAKSDLTGAVGSVKIADLAKAPVASFAEALAGRVAGVQVNANDGQPGGGINITIRGAGSLTQSTAPLYVIDGFPVENPDPATLNTEEIESMTILKDASSTAIYGSRGANGVVVIQTKRGKIGKPVFSLNTKAGVQFTPKAMELMSPYEYVKYQQEISPSTASTTAFFAGGKTLEDYRNIEGLNFQDYILRTGQLQMHDISLRGGNDQTKYSISGSGFNQKGAIINTGFQRYSGRVTIDQNISKKFKAGITANYSNTVQSGQVVNLGAIDQNSPTAFVLARAWMYRPISYDEGDDLLEDVIDDNVITANDLRVNPLQDMKNQDQRNKLGLLEANGYLTYTIIPSLNFKVAAGIRNNSTIQERFYNSKTSQGAPTPLNLNGINGSITNIILNGFSNEYTLNYKKNLKSGHNFSGLGLFAINGLNTSVNGYGGRLLPNEVLGLDGIDQGIGYNLISRKSRNTMVSYAGRFDYNYRSKYMLTLTFRADGSSKFVNSWGYFPGAAIAWNMQKEKFFSKAFPAISSSKIRLSYGSNGNNRVGDFDTYKQLEQSTDGYSFNNGMPTNAVFVSNVGNRDLEWEKVNTLDLGYELGLFKNRVTFEFDMYRRSTSNLLLNALLPLSTGYSSAVKNIGKLRNDGLEFTLNTTNISKRNFNWQTNFNISFNSNKIIELTRGQEGLPTNAQYVVQFNRPLYLAQIGYPAGMMIGYIWDGNYQYEDFDNPAPGVYNLKATVPTNGALRNTIQPGDIKYRDLNGDGTMSDADITFIGRGQPIHTGGFSNNFSYKGFDLNIFFQWSYGNDIYNANRLTSEGNATGGPNRNQFASYVNRWSPENQTNANYRAGGQGPIGFHSSRVVEDGSFLRFKTLALSYSIPTTLVKKLYMSKLAITAAAQNLITWTNYSGMDPEVSTRNNVLTPGYDYSSYPKSPSILFGLSASF